MSQILSPSPFWPEKIEEKPWNNPKFSCYLSTITLNHYVLNDHDSLSLTQDQGSSKLLARSISCAAAYTLAMRPLIDPYRIGKNQQAETEFVVMKHGNATWEATRSMKCLLNMWFVSFLPVLILQKSNKGDSIEGVVTNIALENH